ncbi:MAG: hypothetical protein ABI682_03920 [Acidobacteriota bacterium]
MKRNSTRAWKSAAAGFALLLLMGAARASGAPCVASSSRLCLNGGRFAAEVSWTDFQGNTGSGQAISLTGDTGYFWFFSPNNVELIVKVLDGRVLNSNFWVFYGALSNVAYSMRVTDSATGAVKTYDNPSGRFASVGDTAAFSSSGKARQSSATTRQDVEDLSASNLLALKEALLRDHDPAASERKSEEKALKWPAAQSPARETGCVGSATALCLNDGRFRVSVTWRDFAGNTGAGTAVPLTGDTGYFWFFSSNNVELAVKVLDARVLNDAFWVFFGALSNVEYTMTVTDSDTGQEKTYRNPAGNFGSTGDTSAFPQHLPAVKTSEQLIAEDLTAGAITEEQALVYRVYVAYGSPSLPAKYKSTASPGIDLPIAKAVAERFPTLSPAAQAALQPYLHPPIYAGSWGDPSFAASLQPGAAARDSSQKSPARAAAVCSGSQEGPLPGWGQLPTAHFTVWYRTAIPAGFTYSLEETHAAALNIAAIADEVWEKLTPNFQVPLTDANEVCNGGDGTLDIYMDKMGFGALAQTMVYLPGCAARPSWMWINPLAIQDPTTARDVFAHEFMHMVETAYSRGRDCDDYAWLDEAAANWAIDFVYAGDPFEHDFARQYYDSDYHVPIEKSLVYGRNGYVDYVFLFYLSHKLGPDQGPKAIKHIYENAQLYSALDSLENATSAFGGLKVMWPGFATAGWNDWKALVADDFYKWDKLTWGGKRASDDSRDSAPVDMKGLSRKTFDLARYFYVAQSDNFHTIEPLSATYIDLTFPDATARYVVVHNKPAELAPTQPHLHIRALQKIGGRWKAEEDWTNKPSLTFCRDAKAERLEELVLIYSNSNPDRPGFDSNGNDASRISLENSSRTETTYAPTIEVSNIGCFRWSGNASVTTATTSGFTTVESATATFDRYRFPGTVPEDYVGLDTFKSTNSGTATYSVDGPLAGTSCTISGTASGALQGDGELIADAGFVLTFLVDPPLKGTAIGSGATNIPAVTSTITCPNQAPERTTGPKDVHWLLFPQAGATVSDDGLVISGQSDTTDSDGAKHSVWVFRAFPEE